MPHKAVPNNNNEYKKPGVSERLSRACGDNTSVPTGLVAPLEACKDTFCVATTPKPTPPTPNPGTDDDGNRYVINEFYAYNPAFTQMEEFIEIRITKSPKSDIKTFPPMRIVVFTIYTMRMVLVVTLTKQPIPENGFFYVRGTMNNKNYIQTPHDLETNYRLLPPGDEPVAIVLLERGRRGQQEWEKFQLAKRHDNLRSSLLLVQPGKNILHLMRPYVIDAVLYGVLRNEEVPDDVMQLLPPTVSGCNYILPTVEQSNEQERMFSFNLCGEFDPPDPFQYSKFKLGSPTMGAPNDCTRDIPFQITRVEQSQSTAPEQVGVTANPSTLEECPSSTPGLGFIENEIAAQIKHIQDKYSSTYTNQFYPVNKFTTTVWSQYVNQMQLDRENEGSLSPFEKTDTSPPTLEQAIPYATYYRCSLCYKRVSRCPKTAHQAQRRTPFATEIGRQLPMDLSQKHAILMRHLGSKVHLTSILFDVEKDRIKIERDVNEELPYKVNQTKKFKQIANIIDITFTFLHTNTAPSNAPPWYRTLRKIEAEVGKSHHSRDTAFAIIDFISDVGTDAITQYLIAADDPFSLILDGSSDSRNYHYVLVYLQCTEGGVTIPYLFFILELKTSFTADAYLQALQAAVRIKGPDFQQYFMRRLVGVITDSASVMKLFHTLLNQWLGRKNEVGTPLNVVSIYCLAHKLQLASRSAIVPLKSDNTVLPGSPIFYLSTLEKLLQSLYVWFRWAGKRINVFRELSELPNVELKELHLERWISSEYNTVKNFILSWKTTRDSLETIINQKKTYDKKTIKEATDFLQQMKDKSALITLHFLYEYTSVLKVWSEYLQKMSGLIIDQRKYFDQLMDNLQMLEEHRGPVITGFLKRCTCGTEECSISTFETTPTVFWNDLEFTNQNTEAPSILSTVAELIRRTRERLNVYIPLDLILASSVLQPQRLPPGTMALNYQHPTSGQKMKSSY